MNGYELASYFIDKFGDEGVEKMLLCTRGAETDWLEFKASLKFAPEHEREEKKREDARQRKGEYQNDLYWNVAKALVSLHNTRGGALVIGINDRAARRDAVGVPDDFDQYVRDEIRQKLLRDDLAYSTGRGGAVRHALSRKIDIEVHPASYQHRTVAVLLVNAARDGELLSVSETRNGQETILFYHRQVGHVGQVLCETSETGFERGLTAQDLDGIKDAFELGRVKFFGPDPLPASRRFLRVRVDKREGNTAYCFEITDADTVGLVFPVDLAQCNLKSDIVAAIRAGDVLALAEPRTNPLSGLISCLFLVWNPDFTLSPKKLGRSSIYGHPEIKYWFDVFSPGIRAIYANQGAFANQCLAECIADPNAAFKSAEDGTFHKDPCAVALGYPPNYPRQRVFENIDRFIRQDVSKKAYRDIPRKSWRTEVPLVEPDLGLSAKADAVSISDPITQKASISLEVKSGDWILDHRANYPRREHTFQPAVYGAALANRSDGREPIRSLLFYPKPTAEDRTNGFCYSQPGDLFSSKVQECVNIRNQVLLFERRMEERTALDAVSALSVDDFRNPRQDNRWNRLRTDIEKVLTPFLVNDPLAREWSKQFLAFAAVEDRLDRMGAPDNGNERACQADAWRLPLETRIKRGFALELQFPPAQTDIQRDRIVAVTVPLVTSDDDDDESIACSIREGDSVYLYPNQGINPGITTLLPLAAIVKKLTSNDASFQLEEPVSETAAAFGTNRKWIAEARNDYGQDLLFRGSVAPLAGVPRRRDILLGRVDPGFDSNARVPPQVETDSDIVRTILDDVWRANDYFLIWGPPGTGKTHKMIPALVEAQLAADETGKILLLAYTNRAADELCDMLERLKKERRPDLDWWRIGNTARCAERHRSHLPSNRNFPTEDAVRNEFDRVRVFVGTISSLGPDNFLFELGRNAAFKLAVIDEASQLLEPQITPLFCARKINTAPDANHRNNTVEVETDDPLIEKFVFVGDDRQLPAVVQQSQEKSRISPDSELSRATIQLLDRRDSLFERLHRLCANDSRRCGLLREQHRMPPVLSRFVNTVFYDGELTDAADVAGNEPSVPDECNTNFERSILGHRLGFVPLEDNGDNRDAKSNEAEADYCARIVSTLLRWEVIHYDQSDKIGIVVPFRKQINRIRKAMRDKNIPDEFACGVLIDTVERFQGSQYDVVLYSTVVSTEFMAERLADRKMFGQIEVDRKLNVAITRAKQRFFLVGNEEALSGLPAYRQFIDYIRKNDGVIF